MNAVMDEALAVERENVETEDAEVGTLDEVLAEAHALESEDPETTSATPTTDEEAGTTGTTTSSGTSAPITTVPELTDKIVTVTSERSITSNSAMTSASTSRPSASAKPSASASATPPSTLPTSQATTSTSAAPVIVIPDEPGTLASNARLDDVETITVGEEELDVVAVKGEDIPADAKRGAQALEVWLGGGNAGTAWKAFTSDDPDDDGWRWAAINQKTGTVVYIR